MDAIVTPAWASKLAATVCEAEGVAPPRIMWKRRGAEYRSSSGTYYAASEGGPRIVIRAGKDRKDQRLVLLHELAHHLAPAKEHHGKRFWRIAWRLYREHRLASFALIRERHYKAAATEVAVELRIPGAREARRVAAKARPKRGVCPMPADEAEAQGYRTPHTHYVGTVHYGEDYSYMTGGKR